MPKQMSKISACDQTDCAYNKHNACHTLAITVGGVEDECAMCDTYMNSPKRGGVEDATGGVGACKVDDCKFNESFECNAGSIKVAPHQGHPDCTTYQSK